MSAIPSVKNASILGAALGKNVTNINCVHCKKLLWKVTVNIVGGRIASTETDAYSGVKPYAQVWKKTWDEASKSQKYECVDPKCPFCGKDHLKAILAQGKYFARPNTVEFD